MSDEIKKRVESVLFAAGNKLPFDDIVKIVREKPEDVKTALEQFKHALDDEGSSLMLMDVGNEWKLTVREKYIPFVKQVVSKTEFPKSVMETLAVIAYKAPVLQSEVIKIRTNKAYDHLSELEKLGYISRKKHGRTRMIILSDQFFQYFDLPPDRLEAHFKHIQEQEQAVTATEEFLKDQKRALKSKKDEAKQKEIKQKQVIEQEHQDLDEQIGTAEQEHLGKLDVVDIPEPEKKEEPIIEEKKKEIHEPTPEEEFDEATKEIPNSNGLIKKPSEDEEKKIEEKEKELMGE